MSTILNICGIIVIITGLIGGFLSGSFLGFIFGVLGSAVSAVLFFGIAKISDMQETIMYRLLAIESRNNVQQKQKEDNKVCSNCNYKYNASMSSCPNCGNRRA